LLIPLFDNPLPLPFNRKLKPKKPTIPYKIKISKNNKNNKIYIMILIKQIIIQFSTAQNKILNY
jgi:hypothetical protein